jgi:hypothetical protein
MRSKRAVPRFWVATSKAIGDPALLVELATFLAEAKFDVIHFNVGMHGWDYTEQEYRQHLPDHSGPFARRHPRPS